MKKALNILFVFCMAVVLCHTPIYANSDSNSVSSEAEIIQKIQNNSGSQVINLALTTSITLSKTLVIPTDKQVTIDLKGYNLVGSLVNSDPMIVIEEDAWLHLTNQPQALFQGSVFSQTEGGVVIENHGYFSAEYILLGSNDPYNEFIIEEGSSLNLGEVELMGTLKTARKLDWFRADFYSVKSKAHLFFDSDAGIVSFYDSTLSHDGRSNSLVEVRGGYLSSNNTTFTLNVDTSLNESVRVEPDGTNTYKAPIVFVLTQDAPASISSEFINSTVINNSGHDLLALSNQNEEASIHVSVEADRPQKSRIGVYDRIGSTPSFIAPIYHLNFYDFNDLFISSVRVYEGISLRDSDSSFPTLPNSSKYTFHGWDLDLDTPVTQSLDVYPLYDINTNYDIKVTFLDYYGNELHHERISSNLVIDEACLLELFQAPDLRGILFKGWRLEDVDTTDDFDVYPKVIFDYVEVIYHNFNGDPFKSVWVLKDNDIYEEHKPILNDTSRYTFKGWNDDLKDIHETTKVYPLFEEKETSTYKLTYLDYSGSVYKSYDISMDTHLDYDEIINRHTLEDQGDLLFQGWSGYHEHQDDIILEPIFGPKLIQLTYYDMKGFIQECQYYPVNTEISNIFTPTLNDTSRYTFKGWDFKTDVALEDMDIYPIFEEHTPESISISFMGYNGNELKRFDVPTNSDVDLDALKAQVVPETIEDLTFVSWDTPEMDTSDDIVIWSHYEPISYNLNFYDYSGSFFENIWANIKTPIHTLTTPTLKDTARYTFKGWDFKTDVVLEDMDIYPIFEEHTPETISIIFEDYTGNEVTRFTVPVNSSVDFEALKAQVTLDDIGDNHFYGWITPKMDTSDDILVRPYYAIPYYLLNFHDYTGTLDSSLSIQKGQSIHELTFPTLRDTSRYTFKGWDIKSDTFTQDTEIYPLFEEKTPETISIIFLDYNKNEAYTVNVPVNSSVDLDALMENYTLPNQGDMFFYGWNWVEPDTSDDIIVLPYYSPEQFTVSFEDYSGQIFATYTVYIGEELHPDTLPTLDSDSRFTFLGWDQELSNITSNLIVKPNYTEIIPETITITFMDVYAQTEFKYTVPYGATLDPDFIYSLYTPVQAITDDGKIYTFVEWLGDLTKTKWDIKLWPEYHFNGDIDIPEPVKPSLPDLVKPSLPEPVKPSQPDPVKPSQPDPAKPSQPDPVKPSQPDPVKPSQPDTVKPSQPDPAKPSQSDPVKPSQPDTVKPSLPDQVEPVPVKPVQPAFIKKEAQVEADHKKFFKTLPSIAYLETAFSEVLDRVIIDVPTLSTSQVEAYRGAITDKINTESQTVSNMFVVSIAPLNTHGTKMTQVNGTVTVTINVPSTLDSTKPIEVFHVNQDGSMTQLKSTLNNIETLSFEATEFSHFVITNIIDKEITLPTPTPSATIPSAGVSQSYTGLISVALGLSLLLIEQRRKRFSK